MRNDKKEITSKYVKDYYNGFVSNLDGGYEDYRWNANALSKNHYKQTKAAILEALKTKDVHERILEVGSGAGTWSSLLSGRCKELVSMDISKEMIEVASRRDYPKKNVKFLCADFSSHLFEDCYYEVVALIRCFEYFPRKEETIKMVYQCLKKGGKMLLITKNPYYSTYAFKKAIGKGDLLHSSYISHKRLRDICLKYFERKITIKPAIFNFNILFDKALKIRVNDFISKKDLFLNRYLSLFLPFAESYLVEAKK